MIILQMNTCYALRLKCNIYSLTPKLFLLVAIVIKFHTFIFLVEWKGNSLIPSGRSSREKSTFPKSTDGKILFQGFKYRRMCVNPFKFHRNVQFTKCLYKEKYKAFFIISTLQFYKKLNLNK